ncbi:MAG: 16S rRNA (cytosine(967)-C(5))-methyltransferase, partial [Spongiibacter sp.]
MSCPRVAAARCLVAVVDGQSLSRQIPLQEKSLPEKQRPLYRELCYGTLRRYWQLDAALKPCFSKGLKRKDSDIRMLIYIGAYQLFFTRIPPHAAISSAVEACKTLKKKWAAGLCNAILRRCQRDGEALFK